MEAAGHERGMHGLDAVIDVLERHEAAYEVIEHRDTLAATSEARAAGTPPDPLFSGTRLRTRGDVRFAQFFPPARSPSRWSTPATCA